MISKTAFISALLSAGASAQQVGTLTTENHPALPIQSCSASGCSSVATTVTLDANWRWLHATSGATNCYTGNAFNDSYCPDGKTCAQNCAVDGADYTGTYGVTATGNALNLKFVTKGPYSSNIGSRLYLMASESKYYMFKLLNKEFTFDVDVSNLPCGFNGALYLVEMEEDGGLSKYPTNKAGAKYGTGYCDTQCPHDIKFINGEVRPRVSALRFL
jgi:cellulose 1,4-beta-cellobiosidase